MDLKKGSKLYVRVDYKIEKRDMTPQDFEAHLNYVNNVAKERFFVGGGFSNIDGGMILLEADNVEEAKEILQNDPIIYKGLYRYELFEWELAVLTEYND
ncbi:MAG: YciI family protein [Oscillospiraceae bacterium]|nr:YciI family protein [Oscillospiraceae bacterium]